MFVHNFVQRIELDEQMIDGKRFYSLPGSPVKLKSVTTVLGEKLDKTALNNWRLRVGSVEAARITGIAATRGKSIHNLAESHLMNHTNIFDGAMPFNITQFIPIQKVLDANVTEIYGIELPLHSFTLNTAGRTDLVGVYNGELSIIDFKTALRPKKEQWIYSYFLQATCYAMMFAALYKIRISQIVIIITVDDEDAAQVFVKDITPYVDKVIDIFTS